MSDSFLLYGPNIMGNSDQLRIRDDRLTNRPRSGGLESYLLHPIRDEEALQRVIVAPIRLRSPCGRCTFEFTFEVGLVKEIVTDLLNEFPHASVTPALQVVCATLYSGLKSGSGEIK